MKKEAVITAGRENPVTVALHPKNDKLIRSYVMCLMFMWLCAKEFSSVLEFPRSLCFYQWNYPSGHLILCSMCNTGIHTHRSVSVTKNYLYACAFWDRALLLGHMLDPICHT